MVWPYCEVCMRETDKMIRSRHRTYAHLHSNDFDFWFKSPFSLPFCDWRMKNALLPPNRLNRRKPAHRTPELCFYVAIIHRDFSFIFVWIHKNLRKKNLKRLSLWRNLCDTDQKRQNECTNDNRIEILLMGFFHFNNQKSLYTIKLSKTTNPHVRTDAKVRNNKMLRIHELSVDKIHWFIEFSFWIVETSSDRESNRQIKIFSFKIFHTFNFQTKLFLKYTCTQWMAFFKSNFNKWRIATPNK